ncbi:MAG TPA: methyltransferase domain-containing protein [Methylomirabilota bacterium]|jgi:trans-aconitate methyltransferase|nr:methyltransferase domain-containing protein [Methylomirabilota bacterium]
MATTAQHQWSPEQYAKNARFVSDLGMPVVTLLAPRPGERVLDVGCGDGPLTKKLVELGCEVTGVDASPAMVEAAKALGLDARVMDGQALQFEREFDAVFSNAALHWMKQADAVIAGVWRALKPGGRFVGEFGGDGNTATVLRALEAALQRRGLDFHTLSPWYFPTVEEYHSKLAARGFVVNTIALIPRPTPLPGNLSAWLETFAQSFLAPLSAAERARFLAEVEDRCRPVLCDVEGKWSVDYVRLRFTATKPDSAP